MKHKVIVITAMSFTYAVLCVLWLAGLVVGGFGGALYYFYTVLVLAYSCALVFNAALKTKAPDEAALTGALSLGGFALNETYNFVYFYIYGGDMTKITVSFYSAICAFLLLSTTLFLLISPSKSQRLWLTIALNIGFTVVIAFIMFAVISNDLQMLYRWTLIAALCTTLPACYILFCSVRKTQSAKRFKPMRLISVLTIIVCLFHSYSHTMRVNQSDNFFRYIFFSLYPPLYLILGMTILGLFKIKERAHE